MALWYRGTLSGLALSMIGLGFFAVGQHVLWLGFSAASLVSLWYFVRLAPRARRKL